MCRTSVRVAARGGALARHRRRGVHRRARHGDVDAPAVHAHRDAWHRDVDVPSLHAQRDARSADGHLNGAGRHRRCHGRLQIVRPGCCKLHGKQQPARGRHRDEALHGRARRPTSGRLAGAGDTHFLRTPPRPCGAIGTAIRAAHGGTSSSRLTNVSPFQASDRSAPTHAGPCVADPRRRNRRGHVTANASLRRVRTVWTSLETALETSIHTRKSHRLCQRFPGPPTGRLCSCLGWGSAAPPWLGNLGSAPRPPPTPRHASTLPPPLNRRRRGGSQRGPARAVRSGRKTPASDRCDR